jgi:phage head maturation protease
MYVVKKKQKENKKKQTKRKQTKKKYKKKLKNFLYDGLVVTFPAYDLYSLRR